MKKIINGKLYDTNTAKQIGINSNWLPISEFNYWEKVLYKKRTGEFFLYIHGGALTEYKEECAGEWCSGEHIIPMDQEEARDWTMENLSADVFIDTFGEVEE